ncbi:hypothetical protein [Streptomyces mirabilis]|uniref:hypothetical protein n=1 Tax=Streptomyces mirabilis TaxID=68239 RepID=UPI0033215AD0
MGVAQRIPPRGLKSLAPGTAGSGLAGASLLAVAGNAKLAPYVKESLAVSTELVPAVSDNDVPP